MLQAAPLPESGQMNDISVVKNSSKWVGR